MTGSTVASVVTVSVCSMCELAQSEFAQVDAVPSEHSHEDEEFVINPETLAASICAALAIPVVSDAVMPL